MRSGPGPTRSRADGPDAQRTCITRRMPAPAGLVLACSGFFSWSLWFRHAVVYGLVQLLQVEAEPGTADPGDPTHPPMRETFGQETIHFGLFFRRNAVPGRVRRELVSASPAQVALFPRMGMSILDDVNAIAPGADRVVHASLNTRHQLKATTVNPPRETLRKNVNSADGRAFADPPVKGALLRLGGEWWRGSRSGPDRRCGQPPVAGRRHRCPVDSHW